MKKIIKFSIVAVIVVFALYNSVYFKSLDEVNKVKNTEAFDAKAIAVDFMANQTKTLPAINASKFLIDISKDVNKYCTTKGKKLGISDDYYFIIEGKATVLAIEEENVLIALNDNKELKIRIATDFIFGNAIRDASAIADIGDFQNTMDFNTISIELNNIVRETIVLAFKQKVKEGDQLYFKGALKVNTKHPNLEELKVIPLIIKFNS